MWDYDIYMSDVDQMLTTNTRLKNMNIEKPKHKETIKTVKTAAPEKKEVEVEVKVVAVEYKQAPADPAPEVADPAIDLDAPVQEQSMQEPTDKDAESTTVPPETKLVNKRGRKAKKKA